jgi:CheY-like chemotaxis protein
MIKNTNRMQWALRTPIQAIPNTTPHALEIRRLDRDSEESTSESTLEVDLRILRPVFAWVDQFQAHCCKKSRAKGAVDRHNDPFYDARVLEGEISGGDMMLTCQIAARWSPETNAVAAILAMRFAEVHPITYGNRERVMLVALLIGQKIIDDTPLSNQDFPELLQIWDNTDRQVQEHEGQTAPWHRRTKLKLDELNDLEIEFLLKLDLQLFVPFRSAAYLMNYHHPDAVLSEGVDTVLQNVICPYTIPAPAVIRAAPACRRRAVLAQCDLPKFEPFAVLVADDDMLSRVAISKAFSAKAFAGSCVSCQNARKREDSLQAVRQGGKHFDAIVVGKTTARPGSPGVADVIRQLRAEGCSAILIACSVDATRQDHVRYQEAGANLCWSKPLPPPAEMARDIAQHTSHAFFVDKGPFFSVLPCGDRKRSLEACISSEQDESEGTKSATRSLWVSHGMYSHTAKTRQVQGLAEGGLFPSPATDAPPGLRATDMETHEHEREHFSFTSRSRH